MLRPFCPARSCPTPTMLQTLFCLSSSIRGKYYLYFAKLSLAPLETLTAEMSGFVFFWAPH